MSLHHFSPTIHALLHQAHVVSPLAHCPPPEMFPPAITALPDPYQRKASPAEFLSLREADLLPGGRFIVVGDIHGELPMFEHLLRHVRYRHSDVVIALGDLVDRGAYSYQTLRRFERTPGFFSLMGDHEAWMLHAVSRSGKMADLWRREGGAWADALSPDTLGQCCRYVQSLPLAAEVLLADGRLIGLVHAEVPPEWSWQQVRDARFADSMSVDHRCLEASSHLLWGRARIKKWSGFTGRVEGVHQVMAGHTVMPPLTPYRNGQHLWVDTGSFWGGAYAPQLPQGRLTAVDPAAGVYWQVSRDGQTYGPEVLP